MSKKSTTRKSTSKRTAKTKSSNNFATFITTRWKLLSFIIVFAIIGSVLLVRSYADNGIGIHIAARATNLGSQTNGPRVVNDSTAAKRNVKSVYVASGSGTNQVSVTQTLKKGRWKVCNIGRPTVSTASGKLRVSDKPYGTSSALTVEAAFKATPTTEYVKLACPVITLPADTTVYISHVVTAGSYNFSTDHITPDSVVPSGAVPCGLKASEQTCWENNTGVKSGTGFSESQIVNGQSNLKKVTSQATAPAGTSYDNGNLSVNVAGTTVDRIWLDGCIAVKAKNVTIKNSLLRTAEACYGGDGKTGGAVINMGGDSSTSGLNVSDVTVNGRNSSIDLIGISISGTCTRCHVHSATKGFWALSGATIKESLVSSTSTNNHGIHSEAIDADSSSNVVIDHVFLRAIGSDATTAAIFLGATWGPASNIKVNNSYLEGGDGADLHCAPSDSRITVTNNMLSSNNGYGGTTYASSCGNMTNTVWSNNKVPETGKTVNADGSLQ